VAKQVGICDADRPSLTLIGKSKNDVTLVHAVSPKGSQTQGKTGNNLSGCQCVTDIGLHYLSYFKYITDTGLSALGVLTYFLL
jgi:hypothetical protein